MTEIKPVLNENGFTLIETMLAIAIMAIGLLALASLQVTAIGGNAQSKKRTLALSLAEDKIETYRHTAYASIPAGQEVETGLETLYTRNTNVENDTPVTGVKTVTVTVFWHNMNDKLKQVQLVTIVANYGNGS